MSQKYRKNRKSISVQKRGLILCEGETEENYFRGLILQEEYRSQFASIDIKIYKPKNHSPLGLVTEAKDKIKEASRLKDPYSFAWVVFDRDGHQNLAQSFQDAKTNKLEINIAFTVTCFEYFVLLHFEKTTKSFNKCDDVIHEVRKHIPDYEKASNIFNTLAHYHETGLKNSDWCLKQCENDLLSGIKPFEISAYSNIHEIVTFLYKQIKDLDNNE